MSKLTATAGGGDRADEDFDDLVRQLWDEHLCGLDATTAASKRRKSGYWKNWYRDFVLEVDEAKFIDECEDVVERVVLCAGALHKPLNIELRRT